MMKLLGVQNVPIFKTTLYSLPILSFVTVGYMSTVVSFCLQ